MIISIHTHKSNAVTCKPVLHRSLQHSSFYFEIVHFSVHHQLSPVCVYLCCVAPPAGSPATLCVRMRALHLDRHDLLNCIFSFLLLYHFLLSIFNLFLPELPPSSSSSSSSSVVHSLPHPTSAHSPPLALPLTPFTSPTHA